IVKVMCAMVIVVTPRSNCQPKKARNSCSRDTNNNNIDRPVMTSGMTSGAVVRPCSSARPLNGPKRASTSPASVPSTTAPEADMAATRMDSQAADRICSSPNNFPYHLTVGEVTEFHTVTERESLNEYTTIDRMGTYRNAKPSPSTLRENNPCVFIAACSSFLGLQLFVLEVLEQHDGHDQQQ